MSVPNVTLQDLQGQWFNSNAVSINVDGHEISFAQKNIPHITLIESETTFNLSGWTFKKI